MPPSEFDIISTYFSRPPLAADPRVHEQVVLGIGDDCALIKLKPGFELALSLDVLVSDVHFPAKADPSLIAKRALAVNLSDLAAMGAQPLGFTLGLTLPDSDLTWLEGFSRGLADASTQYSCPLLGGDLTRGPLQIAIQVHGQVPAGAALRRSGASDGDDVYVSGHPGLAGLALRYLETKKQTPVSAEIQVLRDAYYSPVPRLRLGTALRGIASACQDISDGLLADLGHICTKSRVAMELEAQAIPVAPILLNHVSGAEALNLVLTAGDDYELVFTAAQAEREKIARLAAWLELPLHRIGKVCNGAGVSVLTADGSTMRFAHTGYQHFSAQE